MGSGSGDSLEERTSQQMGIKTSGLLPVCGGRVSDGPERNGSTLSGPAGKHRERGGGAAGSWEAGCGNLGRLGCGESGGRTADSRAWGGGGGGGGQDTSHGEVRMRKGETIRRGGEDER